jgi:phage shock protein C
MLEKVRLWFEQHAFGVCTWWGEKLGIKATDIRLYFIYLSFFTFGSPIIMYFVMAFILEHKNYFKPSRVRRRSIWEL